MADQPAPAAEVCARDTPAPAGESELGDTPFLDGFTALLDRVFGGSDGWFATALSAVSLVVLTPFAWFADLCGALAHVFAYVLELLYLPAAAFSFGALDPALLAATLFTVLLRFASLPLLVLSGTQSTRNAMAKPKIGELRRKYAKDPQRQAREIQKFKRSAGVAHAGIVLRVAVIVVAISGVWKLFQGMTVRSAEGTFAPAYVHAGTPLYQHLAGLRELGSFGMNLTRSIPQIGYCAKVVPYLVSFGVVIAIVVLSLGPLWRDRRGVAAVIVVLNVLAVVVLPSLLVLLRISDGLMTWLQSRYLTSHRGKVVLRLRSDPDFVRSLGELGTDFLPGTDTAPPRRHADPPDLPPHR